jgi:hypothetical protein
MTWDEVERRIKAAISDFILIDLYLLEVDAHERTISHRLAMYLQVHFEEWQVDCEYNRADFDTKRLESLRDKNDEAATVFPDIIVHERGTNRNLLVVEMKKAGREHAWDDAKLRAYQKDLGYEFAVFLTFSTGTEAPGFGDIEPFA